MVIPAREGALSVTFGDSSPGGGAKSRSHQRRIGAFSPLPSGEVAAAHAADGEGKGEMAMQ